MSSRTDDRSKEDSGALLALASEIAGRASKDEAIEAFVTHEREFYVKVYEGEVESLSSAQPRGAGVRAIVGGRAGFAYSTDLSTEGIEAVVAQARDNATYATPDEAVAVAERAESEPAPIPGLFDDEQPEVGPDDKVTFALTLERATRAADKRVRTVEEAVYGDSEADVAIAVSTGIAGSYRRSDAWCYSVAIAEDDGDTEIGFEFDLGRGLGSLDANEVARQAAARAVGVLGASKIPSARMPVVFDPYTAGQFLGVLGSALTAEAVQKGRSLFAGRLGEAVASGNLSLIDDGRAEGAPGSAPWDAEGVATQRTGVITKGVLTSYLYDTASARREGRPSTGNAARAGFKSAPGPAPSNMTFDTTGEGRDEVLGRAGRALLVQDFHGVHSGANSVTGDFSVGVTGFLLEDGAPVRPVKEVTIAAPMLEILKGIEAVAVDRRWLPFGGSFGGATTLISEMTVAGL
ncbi:MAG: TldD/PmbA family protein [Actinobacteria bacterium]|nr:TldD/PmbA family protein [Actinomycetota bacterium]